MGAEPETETVAVDEEGVRRHVCPECGEEYGTPMHLGLHRKRAHGVEGKSEHKRKGPRLRRGSGERTRATGGAEGAPRRPRSESAHTRRARVVEETIREFLTFSNEVRGRGADGPLTDLADVVERDARKIAGSIAWAAERFNPLALAVDKLAGHGGVITFARGFMGVGTWLIRRWRQLLAERETETAYASIPVHAREGGEQVGWTDGLGRFWDMAGVEVASSAALDGSGADGPLAASVNPDAAHGGPDFTSHTAG